MADKSEVTRSGPVAGTGVSVSLRMLVLIRWVALTGQAATLLLLHFGFGFALPITGALAVVATSAALNIAVILPRRASARLGDREAALYLAYDTLQLGMLLFLTGGLQNPFAILILAPVTVSATILSRRSVVGLALLTVAALSAIALIHLPLPWSRGDPIPPLPPLYLLGIWTALVSSTLFIAGYIWTVAQGARRMRDAFAATQLALAREQRVSAVGALAAAAAHQLGSPLATIAVIAKELVRELPPTSPHAEDAQLLLSQSERCRTILTDLVRGRAGEAGEPFARLPFSALVEAAFEPHRSSGVPPPAIEVVFTVATDGKTLKEPELTGSPEIVHGLGNLIENAAQFARSEVVVTTSWSEDMVAVDIVDDGPGFPPQILARLGEPYISGRNGETAHMGLGIFIAQSLLERTGAHLAFANRPHGGAEIVIEWKRAELDA